MGVSIYYGLRADIPSPRVDFSSPQRAKAIVEQLRWRAQDLPFAQVGDVMEFSGPDCDYAHYRKGDPARDLLVNAATIYTGRRHLLPIRLPYLVLPKHVFAFTTCPGPGAAAATFGLAIHPRTLSPEDCRGGELDMRDNRLRLTGWRWTVISRTGDAIDVNNGGVGNFLRCHLSILQMLKHAQSMDILEYVLDDGGYWQSFDLQPVALLRDNLIQS